MKSVSAAAVGILSLMLLAACNESEYMKEDASATKTAVVKDMPLGSPVDQAQSLLEQRGYRCTSRQGEKYVDEGFTPSHQVTRGPVDFVWCDTGDLKSWNLITTNRWQVIFEVKDGRISYVGTSFGHGS